MLTVILWMHVLLTHPRTVAWFRWGGPPATDEPRPAESVSA